MMLSGVQRRFSWQAGGTASATASRGAFRQHAVFVVGAVAAVWAAVAAGIARSIKADLSRSKSGHLVDHAAFIYMAPMAKSGSSRTGWSAGSSVRRHADPPDVREEPDFGGELAKIFSGASGVEEERELTAADRVTPIDRWFGWDRAILQGRDGGDTFVDSSDEANYVTLWLEKPLGVEFVENSEDEGGGVVVGEVCPDYSAYLSGAVYPGYHLVAADDTPVYGLPFEDVLKPIIDKEGLVKLTFFTGDALYFYGEFRPTAAWMTEFLTRLKELPPPEDQ